MRDERRDAFELSSEDLDLVANLSAMPGAKDSTILTLDSVLTLLRLFKAEAAYALDAVPALLGLAMFRAPVYVFAWLSFCVFAACVAYTVMESLLWGAGTLFALQMAAAVVLELRIRRLHKRLDFTESRKGLAVMQASLKARLKGELQGEQTKH